MKVFVTGKLSDKALDALQNFAQVDAYESDDPMPREQVEARLAGKDALVCILGDKVDSALFQKRPQLKLVANVAVGYDNINIADANDAGVLITNTPGVLDNATADLAFGLLLSAARRIVEADGFVRRGEWKGWKRELMLGAELHGKTLGIVGMGRIGKAVAKRARAFGLNIIYARKGEDKKTDDALKKAFEAERVTQGAALVEHRGEQVIRGEAGGVGHQASLLFCEQKRSKKNFIPLPRASARAKRDTGVGAAMEESLFASFSSEKEDSCFLHIEPKQHHVAIPHDVFLAFHMHLARCLGAHLALIGDVVLVADGFRRDEAAFEVAMDHAGGGRRLGAGGDGPGAGFLGAAGEVGDEAQQGVALADHPVEPAVIEAQALEEFGAVFLGKLRDLGLDGRRDDDVARTLALRALGDAGGVGIAGGGFASLLLRRWRAGRN